MKITGIPSICFYLLTAGMLFGAFPAKAQVNMGGGDGGGGSLDSTKNFSFVPVPYISYDRSIGGSFGLIPMAMYKVNKNDTVSPASISGLFGMYTTNDTWFAMFFQALYLRQDNWRIFAGGGLGSVNFQFYLEAPIDGYVNYNTAMNFMMVKVQRRLYKKLYLGAFYQYVEFNTSLQKSDVQLSYDVLNGVGLSLQLDLRDNVYYPRNGLLTELKWVSFPELLDNKSPSDKLEFDYNHYFGVRENRDVIAARFYAGAGIGDLTFNQQFIVGRDDIRGYTQGKYRGNQTLNIQGEYRWNFYRRFSAVGFVGLATIFNPLPLNESQHGELLPGVGCGFRYNVFPQYHMNVGLDFAVGKDDWGIYFRIGEAF